MTGAYWGERNTSHGKRGVEYLVPFLFLLSFFLSLFAYIIARLTAKVFSFLFSFPFFLPLALERLGEVIWVVDGWRRRWWWWVWIEQGSGRD